MRIVTVLGARPQFIKAAPFSRIIRDNNTEVLVHTGQHYHDRMSSIFFQELGIPQPDYNLGVGSGMHGEQTGKMLAQIENVLIGEKPDWVLVYGDTNSTLAGALAAVKLDLPVIHIEAGMRSYNRKMPEEVNRVLTDNISTILSCPTKTAVDNLKREGFTNTLQDGRLLDLSLLKDKIHIAAENPLVVNTGDIMYDALKYYRHLAIDRSIQLQHDRLLTEEYILVTVHRAENTDCPTNLRGVMEGLRLIPNRVLWPIHPRTAKQIDKFNLTDLVSANIEVVEPVGYLEMLELINGAAFVITDSGGIQKEAFFLDTPCITLRDETEWVETVESGGNVLAGLGGRNLKEGLSTCFKRERSMNPYGDGRAGERIAGLMNKIILNR